MQGVQFLTNAKGKKIAVMIDLRKHGELWEDFYDRAVAAKRAGEARETLESVKKRLRKAGKIGG